MKRLFLLLMAALFVGASAAESDAQGGATPAPEAERTRPGAAGPASVIGGNAVNTSEEAWVSIGHFGIPLSNNDVISGQVNAVAVDPRGTRTLYIGASEGGVWKTSDYGATWRPLTDSKLVREIVRAGTDFVVHKGTSAVGAIALDPDRPDTVYVGTGNPNPAITLPQTTGLGVFRSTDGGEYWSPLGRDPSSRYCPANKLMSQAVVNRIVVSRGSPNVVYAATDMGLFAYAEESDCWKNFPDLAAGGASDLAFDAFRRVLYVAVAGQGVFRSSEPLGQKWTKLNGGFPDKFGRVALAFGGRTIFGDPAPVVYAGFASSTGYQLFKTGDGGDSWARLPSPPDEGQLNFNNALAVGMFSPDDVYVGQVSLWRSLDGGDAGGLNDYKGKPPVEDNSWSNLSCCLSFPPAVERVRTGMDLHADIHDIVFAPVGSYVLTPQALQVVYVANDGGVSRGFVDSKGAVAWQPLTRGLAISQVGTIAIDPREPSVTVSGQWHNGDAKLVTGEPTASAFGVGDGFETGFDPAPATALGIRMVYHNCNAGVGGSICRSKFHPIGWPPAADVIWSRTDAANSVFRFWSDPYRPGHLLRLGWNGALFRVKTADTSAPAALDSPGAWEAINPPGRTGNIYTLAFRSALLEGQPVYYLGTSTGQIWRGSPEAGWAKVCECGKQVNAIGPDLVKNERIFAVLNAETGPGRIKELTRRPDGTWASRDIDKSFPAGVDVSRLNSIVADPLVPAEDGATVYVGTDQGMYRGRYRPPVGVGGAAAAGVIGPAPTAFEWAWTRSPGVPHVMVTDIEIHQGPRFRYQTGVIRAATFGRGVFQLDRAPAKIFEKFPLTLEVTVAGLGEDGPPRPLKGRFTVVSAGRKFALEAPFPLTPEGPAEITLEAPAEIRDDGSVMKFVGWVVNGRRRGAGNKLTLNLTEGAAAVAYYEAEERPSGPKGGPPRISVSANEELLCADALSHRLAVAWDVFGERSPLTATLAITYPDGHTEFAELKPLHGSQRYALSAPKGGPAKVRVTATDPNKLSTSAELNLRLRPCQ